MNVLNKSQRHLLADYLNNISAGRFLLGVVAPFFTGMKIDWLEIKKVIFSLLLSIMIISLGLGIVKK